MKLWVDDIRQPPVGWEATNSAVGAMQAILNNPTEALSLDHDLGQGQPTGMDLLYAMARLNLKVASIVVHSANPPGRENMEAFIKQMELEG